MKKIISLFAFIGMFSTAKAQIDYNPKFETMKGQEIVCPAGTEESNTFVPPPKFILDAIKNKTRLPAKSSFVVTYKGFPPAAQRAFQEAVDIWSGLISSPVPIRVDANWEKLAQNVLGSASPADFVRNFDGAQKAFTWYPIALAEKLARREINGSEPDITARFSSSVNWFLNSSGAPGTGQFDFVSVVLHELGHGLGFMGSIRVATTGTSTGSWGYGTGSPFVFDQYVENASGQRLVDTLVFKNVTTKLATEIISDNLFFNSPIATNRNGGVKPKLYAPNTYEPNSSIYHLDQATYPAGNINSLMTPATNQREVTKDPGPLVLNMFTEMGWKGTAILHNRLTDTENLTEPIVFKTRIESDTTIVAGSPKFVYSINDATNTKKIVIDLKQEGNTDTWSYSLPPTAENKTIRYYFEVKDNSGRTFANPPEAPKYTWSFYMGPDTKVPTISHFPVDIAYEKDSVFITAQVLDNVGVDTVYAEYSVNGAAVVTLGMKRYPNNIYEALLPFSEIKGGNKIRYRIVAKDKAKIKNQGLSPLKDYYEFAVVKLNAVQSRYVNNFNGSTADFAGTSFSITQPAGFDNPAIHSDHPYKNGNNANFESNYTFQLLTPIKIRADTPTIRFNEIVLVEPSETGAKFGQNGFYDYVIVEGTTDGINWVPFIDGYNARANKRWLDDFNNSPVKDLEFSTATQTVTNSSAKGTKDMFVTREINMISGGDFVAGDVVLIRFRLFADQLSYGWGWAIDNLQIQVSPPPIITAIEQPREEIDLSLSPNPSPDELKIKSTLLKPGKVKVEIVNMAGVKVLEKDYDSPTVIFHESISTKALSDGTYILKIHTDSNQKWRRFVVAH